MSTTSDSLGRRAGRAFTRLVVTLLVLGLLGAVGFLLSQLNARTFTLEMVDGKLVVMKGRLLPLGSEPYRPSEPALAAAYAPFDLQGGGAGGLAGVKFDERDAMDRALFSQLEGLARPKLVSDDPAVLGQGLALLGRMQKLGGISEEQRRTLKTLESEVAFYQARNWHAFTGEVYCEQPEGRIRFTHMAPFVFDIVRAPRLGTIDLCGLPW